MREMKPETIELLKSRKMIGADKYNYELKLEGTEYYSDIKEVKSVNLMSGIEFMDYAIRSDGKVLIAYVTLTGEIRLSTVDSEEEMLSIDFVIPAGELLTTTAGAPNPISLLRLNNGKLLLFIGSIGNSTDVPYSIKCFESANGLGNDFTYKSTLFSFQRTHNNYWSSSLKISISKTAHQKDGSIFIGFSFPYSDLGSYGHGIKVLKSLDNGITWEVSHSYTSGSIGWLSSFNYIKSIIKYNDFVGLTVLNTYGGAYQYIFHSNNGGLSWAVNTVNGWETNTSDFRYQFDLTIDKAGTVFLVSPTGKLYKAKPEIMNFAYLNTPGNWELSASSLAYYDNSIAILSVSPKGVIHFIAQHNGSLFKDTAMIRDEYSAPLKASLLNISKGRGGANTLNLSVNNSNGAINPKNPTSPLYNIINLNKQIIVKQGYGEDLIETFTGLIDSFNMQSYPHTMEISCRDHLKKALDQTITEGDSHTVFFESQPIEHIFGYLCYLAGIETVEIDQTGINISKEFSWQSYADAFQFLADLASFEYGADEYGKLYFRRDFQPDELSIAYTFEEGSDITTLSYKMSDNDLYYKVKVYGKSGETVIGYEALFPDAAKYKIMPQKILKIDVTEASTILELKKIADRSIYLMNSRTAIVNFTAIAVPWLQVGDFIQVNESSSMSAGIYRISSLNLKMSEKEFLMDLECYYYGDSIETGTLPEDAATQAPNATLNLIPEMTSNTSPAGIARASSVLALYDNDYQPWNAFNSTSDDLFWNAVAQYGWIEYQFTEKMIIDKYMLKARQTIDYNKAMPKNWTFEGFDGEKWIILDTKINQTAWGIHEERPYNFTNTAAYSKYRLNVSANNGFNRLQLEQLAMYYRGGV